MLNIIFAGTPQFAAEQLQALIEHTKHNIIAVYTQPDRPKGRGLKLAPSPVKQVATAYNLDVQQPTTLKDASTTALFQAYQCDLLLVVGYGLLLPKEILEAPRYGCINTHLSLLPAYRGAACVQYALLDGLEQTGVTFMQMNEGLDTGDILHQEVLTIHTDDTTLSLTERLSRLTQATLCTKLEQFAKWPNPIPQLEEKASYAPKIKKQQACIDWENDAVVLDRQIRAFFPWPMAYFLLDEKPVKIHRATPIMTTQKAPAGTILTASEEGITVACGNHALKLQTIQLPGKKPTPVKDILNAYQHLFHSGRRLV